MKTLLLVVLLAVAVAAKEIRKRATRFVDHNRVEITDDPEKDYQNYMKEYYPDYNPDEDHHERYAKFMKCRQDAIDHEPDEAGFAKGLTHFCHMTDDEVADQWNHHIGLPDNISDSAPVHQYTQRDLEIALQARNVDWRSSAVTKVKNQGTCGSCYTFAAAAALEGAVARKWGTKYMWDLSTQQYVDCTSGYGNQGCGGGWYTSCWDYNSRGYKQTSWQCYPYTSDQTNRPGYCQNPACQVQMQVRTFVRVNDENALLTAVNSVGPVACALDAHSLQGYTGGVLDARYCSTYANHAITVVGYGTDNYGQAYWLIKNSWGDWWGEQGYFRIPRGYNACGIASNQCAYPVLA